MKFLLPVQELNMNYVDEDQFLQNYGYGIKKHVWKSLIPIPNP